MSCAMPHRPRHYGVSLYYMTRGTIMAACAQSGLRRTYFSRGNALQILIVRQCYPVLAHDEQLTFSCMPRSPGPDLCIVYSVWVTYIVMGTCTMDIPAPIPLLAVQIDIHPNTTSCVLCIVSHALCLRLRHLVLGPRERSLYDRTPCIALSVAILVSSSSLRLYAYPLR